MLKVYFHCLIFNFFTLSRCRVVMTQYWENMAPKYKDYHCTCGYLMTKEQVESE